MSLQQVVQPRPSSNGFGRRKVERETGTRQDNKFPSAKPNLGISSTGGVLDGNKAEASEGPSRDRLVYLATCLIGHNVEVQVKNGSIFSGIFHAMNAENDFGVILKMARLTKDGSFRGQKPEKIPVSKPPSKTLIIPAKELVQVIAKGVSVTSDGLKKGAKHGRQDLMIDSYISQSHFVEAERELGRWAPDEDDLQCPELENIFDGTWNRNWDQFETNEALFGVKSTFDEELYTTKLERGPRMRELEMKASRIAREIEGEETQDLHLAEERGLHFHDNFDIDEETRFSSVGRRRGDDSGYEEHEDIISDSCNTETFGDVSGSSIRMSFSDVARGKGDNLAQASSSSSSVVDETHFPQISGARDQIFSATSDHARLLDGDLRNENQFREQDGRKNGAEELKEKKSVTEEAQKSNFEEIRSSLNLKKVSSDKGTLSSSATAYAPSSVSSKGQENIDSLGDSSDCAGSIKAQAGVASTLSRPGLSPSSSMGSLSSEKSTLNPYAKEFKFNPNAKSFTPSQAPVRSPSPVSDGSYYFPNSVSAVQHMQGLPMGVGIGTSFGGPQPVIYNPQAAPIQSPQAFIHPNPHLQYGQQMIMGHHPRQVLYMPGYPPEMPYKGRDF